MKTSGYTKSGNSPPRRGMTAEDFEKVYVASYDKAIAVVKRKLGRDSYLAEDAVQNAAVYVLDNLDRFERITPSYFIQLAASRSIDLVRAKSARWKREAPVGSSAYELPLLEEYTREEAEGRHRAYTPGARKDEE